jgi:plasmid stabilization system protein ParE
VKIVWSAEVRRELRAIKRFIARDSEFYAARMVASIVERVGKMAEHPTHASGGGDTVQNRRYENRHLIDAGVGA